MALLLLRMPLESSTPWDIQLLPLPLVNALSNAKRAIDCQTDGILFCFGINSKKNFPQKLDILRSSGIIVPRIINKVIRARNYLEHEYKCPGQEQVEDALDIANLFVSASARAIDVFPYSFIIGNPSSEKYNTFPYIISTVFEKKLYVIFDENNKAFSLYGEVINGTRETDKVEGIPEVIWRSEARVEARHKFYIPLIRLGITVEKDQDPVEDYKKLVSLL